GRSEVVEIVVREWLAVELLADRRGPAVERGALMRVFPVGEVGGLLERDRQALRKRLAALEPGRNGRLVRGGRREPVGGERAPRLERQGALASELIQHSAVLLGMRDGGDVLEVLRRASDQR